MATRRDDPGLKMVFGAVLLAICILGVIAGSHQDDGAAPKLKAKPEHAWAPSFSEVDAVTDCDIAVQRQLLAPDSFDSAWSWYTFDHPERGRVTILRDFTAQNGFGAEIAQHYRCVVDASTSRPIDVSIGAGYWR